MTKQEYKMILKLIDKNTNEIIGKETMYGCEPDRREIDEDGIAQLKQDIKDLFDDEEIEE